MQVLPLICIPSFGGKYQREVVPAIDLCRGEHSQSYCFVVLPTSSPLPLFKSLPWLYDYLYTLPGHCIVLSLPGQQLNVAVRKTIAELTFRNRTLHLFVFYILTLSLHAYYGMKNTFAKCFGLILFPRGIFGLCVCVCVKLYTAYDAFLIAMQLSARHAVYIKHRLSNSAN